MTDKPYSQACEENKKPILDVLRGTFSEAREILEIGSGTGQHAVYFGAHLSQAIWHTSDVRANHEGILSWLRQANLRNVRAPLALDVNQDAWPRLAVDGVFSANTVHIMSWASVRAMFAGIATVLSPNGVFCLYGPFNYDNQFTSESNRRFDAWLKQRDPLSGIRNFEDLRELGDANGLRFSEDVEMPVNNRILIWKKTLPQAK